MPERKPVPVGQEDFKELIDKEYCFVDKTLLIKDLLDQKSKVNLITRPRRFGKTLNMSMIQRFFEKTEESNAYLFEGLKISNAGEKYLKHQGQYPVITLSLKSMKQDTYEHAFYEFKNMVIGEFGRNIEVINSDVLLPNEKKKFELIINDEAEDEAYLTSLKLLSECLSKYYGNKVIVLIDEYDVPLENAYFNCFYDRMVNLIRSVFESVLKTNSALEFAVLTGCLRISKESIFTGMNNLEVYPVTDTRLSEYFGFTQDEVEDIAAYYGLEDRIPEMQKWYDGYLFGKTEIYNSWSIVKYIASAIGGNDYSCKAYWINTSSNSIIHQLIEKSDENTRQKIEKLISGGSVKAVINENSVYSDLDVNNDDIWSFLLFTGYLKQINSEFIDKRIVSEMVIPNLEVLTVYEETIRNWFNNIVRKERTPELLEYLLDEKPEEVQKEINRWLRKSISYHDYLENFYHGFLLGAITGSDEYEVKSNRENGTGRTDITICKYQTRETAVIIEVKTADTFKNMNTMCDAALEQIREKKYAEQLTEDCYEKVITYGIAFYGKSCRVKMGEILYQTEEE